MKKEVEKKKNIYKIFNDIVLENQILIFGSTFTANFPFYELSKKYLLSNAIYNRSIDMLTIRDAIKILDDCVFNAKPLKVFYCFGEEQENINLYHELIHKTRVALPMSDIYVLSTPDAEDYNKAIRKISSDNNTYFIDIDYTKSYETIFKQLLPLFRSKSIDFSEAFSMA